VGYCTRPMGIEIFDLSVVTDLINGSSIAVTGLRLTLSAGHAPKKFRLLSIKTETV